MDTTILRRSAGFLFGIMLVLIPAASQGETAAKPGLPPISQQLVREGEFAVRLHAALGLGSVEEEAEAESGLAQAGIMPNNGWIADYPVTPDVMGELRRSVGNAAESGQISLARDEALRKFEEVSTQESLNITPQETAPVDAVPDQGVAEQYPTPTVINNYYQTEGPPVVTYYTPPPDYYYLYGWVPYPFWCAGLWFPGYFILNDFHRSFRAHNRVFFVSNHFNDIRRHRVFRVDPVGRFNGRTFAGIGATRGRRFIPTGVARSQQRIFNAPRAQAAPGMRPLPGMRQDFRSGSGRGFNPAARSVGRVSPARGGAGRGFSAPSAGAASRSFSAPSRGGGGGMRGGGGGGGRGGGGGIRGGGGGGRVR